MVILISFSYVVFSLFQSILVSILFRSLDIRHFRIGLYVFGLWSTFVNYPTEFRVFCTSLKSSLFGFGHVCVDEFWDFELILITFGQTLSYLFFLLFLIDMIG